MDPSEKQYSLDAEPTFSGTGEAETFPSDMAFQNDVMPSYDLTVGGFGFHGRD